MVSTTLKLSVALAGGLLGGCSTIEVATEVASDAPFASYRTFGWFAASQARTGNPRIDSPPLNVHIRSEIDRQLVAKGFRKATGMNPDIYVAYRVALQTRIESSPVRLGEQYVPAWGTDAWANRTLGSRGTYVRESEQGTLVVDVIDATTSRLIWRGTAKTEVDPSDSHSAKKAKIRAAVGRLLRRFPRARSRPKADRRTACHRSDGLRVAESWTAAGIAFRLLRFDPEAG